MNHFDFTGNSRCKETKTLFKEGILPTLIQFVILVVVILEFALFIGEGNGKPNLLDSRFVAGETTNPNIIRLVYSIIALLASVACAYTASRLSKTHISASYWIATIGGIFLWQSLGECTWHFGLECEDYFVFFPRIETASSTFSLFLFSLLLIYGATHHSFDWGVWIFLFTFFGNWAGHFIHMGTYPWVDHLFEEKQWYLYSGLGIGIPGTIFATYCMFFAAKDKKARLFSSFMLYIFMGLIMNGIRGE